jgi:hypothetical protein
MLSKDQQVPIDITPGAEMQHNKEMQAHLDQKHSMFIGGAEKKHKDMVMSHICEE